MAIINDPNVIGAKVGQSNQTFNRPGVTYDPNASIPVLPAEATTSSVQPLTIPQTPIIDPTTVQTPTDVGKARSVANELVGTGEAERTKDALLTARIGGLVEELSGKGQAQLDAEVRAGIPELRQRLADLQSRKLEEQQYYLNKDDAIRKQAGIARDFVTDQSRAAELETTRQQANLALTEMALQGRTDAIQRNIDRRIDLEFSGKQTKLDYYNRLRKENADKMTADENKRFTVAYDQYKSKLEEAKDDQKAIYTLGTDVAKHGAPQSVIEGVMNAKTKKEALKIAAGYVEDPLDRALKQAKLAEARASAGMAAAPTIKEINGADYQWDSKSGQWVPAKVASGSGSENIEVTAPLKLRLDDVNSLLTNKGYEKVVGTFPWGRTPALSAFTGVAQNAAATIHQLTAAETLSTLINLKKAGTTLGALNESELELLKSAASKINDWEEKDEKGKPLGRWNISEADFKSELERIKLLTQKAILNAGGSIESNDERVQAYLQQVTGALSGSSTNPYGAYIK